MVGSFIILDWWIVRWLWVWDAIDWNTSHPQPEAMRYTRVSWKVHGLTKKELCHSDETLRALNSTFPFTNPIVSVTINPHWISTSQLLKNSTRDISKRPGKLTKEVLFHQESASVDAQVCGCNKWCTRLWLWTGWSPSIFTWFGTI